MKANCRINPALTFCIYCIINDLQKSRGEAFAYKNYATNRQLNSANASPVRQQIEHATRIARNVCKYNDLVAYLCRRFAVPKARFKGFKYGKKPGVAELGYDIYLLAIAR
jgi:hypothetical protein